MQQLRLIRLPEVMHRRGDGVTAVYAAIKAGTFVPPVKLTTRTSAWPSHEVDELIAATIAGATDKQLRELVVDLVGRRATLMPKLGVSAAS